MTTIINGSSPSITFSDGSAQTSATRPFLNRIINGNFVIDQRNAGASVTVNSTSQFFPVDRWVARGELTDGVFTVQQSSTAPTTFRNSIIATVTTADASIGATQRYEIYQRIEGNNVADLMWGTANAQTVTLSFWVRSSLTGTFGGSLSNADNDRSYPFTYSVSSANTWEQKSVTIVGDTSGTWNTTTGIGIWVNFSLGAGSSRLGTAGAWAGSFFTGATGQTNIIATNGATFYLTGVQLEVGSTATSFDYRPYTTELQLCQRYYEQSNPTVAASGLYLLDSGSYIVGWNYSGTSGVSGTTFFKVIKRANPTLVTYTTAQGSTSTANRMSHYQGSWTNYPSSIPMSDVNSFTVAYNGGSGGSSLTQYNWTASAEL